ncbi:glycosyltransferase [Mesorhizobium sp. CAU 1732]|uniref:glycosyltransferase n=1 Tax=Mesorhizobium sp. CAU 1732 TaxID=3140358 RepID=UPI003261C983
MPHPVLSIVMPCLDGMPHLPDAIASVHASLPAASFEIVVADGGSTDGSIEYLRGAGVTLLEGPDGSLYHGLNRAIANANGSHIVWLNADDVVLPAVQGLVDRAKGEGGDIVTGEAEIATGETVTWRSDHHARRMSPESLLFAVPTINARVFSRALLVRAGPFRTDIGLGADRHMLLRLLRLDPKREMVSEPVYRYRSHAGSRTMGGSWTSYRSVHAAHLAMAEAIAADPAAGVDDALLDAFSSVSRLASARAGLLKGDVLEAARVCAAALIARPDPGHWRRALALHRAFRSLGSGW